MPPDLARLGRELTVAESVRAVFSGGDGICVYEQTNFRGRSACWRSGEEERNLSRREGLNDRVSSIRVFGRARADVYRDAGFNGGRLQVTRSITDLGQMNWNEQISSIEVH